MSKFQAYLLIIAAAICWGTTGTAQALAPNSAHPLSVGAVRLALGGGALLLIAVSQGALGREKGWPIRTTVITAIAIAAYQLCFFSGVARTGVAVGTMVAIGSGPILAGILTWWWQGERPSRLWAIATTLAIIGCGFLVGGDGGVSLDISGILLAIGAGGAYAVYTLTSKLLLAQQSPVAIVGVTFSLGALLLSPFLFVVDLTWLSETAGALAALHLGLIATALAYLLYVRGLVQVPVTTAVTLALAEPLTASTLGILLLNEPFTLPTAIGMSFIFLGLLLLANPK